MSPLRTIKQRLRAGVRAFAGIEPQSTLPIAQSPPETVTPPLQSKILDYYITSAPTPQQAVDLFKGEWSSALPAPLNQLQAGTIGLFADDRINWAIKQVGGIEGWSVLELGPLEGGHSYMIEQAGASEVIAIEGNSRAFLKCLVVKELLNLSRVRFLCGDFVEYLRTQPRRFDMIVASGVLYHMRNPVELIELMARTSTRIFVWTHYYDESIIKSSPILAHKFPSNEPSEHAGFTYTQYRQEYQVALEWSGFCGGSAPYSAWMTRQELFACVHHFGFTDVRVAFDLPDHPNGPSLAFLATR